MSRVYEGLKAPVRAISSMKGRTRYRGPPVKVVALGLAALALGGAARPHSLAGCSLFPPDNPWNQRVDSRPVASNSSAIIATIGPGIGLHPDFGSGQWNGGPIGIPYNVVTSAQKKVPVKFAYAGESDPGPSTTGARAR
jgi:hypothetical protein